MRIELQIDQTQPPAGGIAVRRDDGPASDGGTIPFSGWLDLIRVLEQLIGDSASTDDGRAH
jgi:hypothetical protein